MGVVSLLGRCLGWALCVLYVCCCILWFICMCFGGDLRGILYLLLCGLLMVGLYYFMVWLLGVELLI